MPRQLLALLALGLSGPACVSGVQRPLSQTAKDVVSGAKDFIMRHSPLHRSNGQSRMAMTLKSDANALGPHFPYGTFTTASFCDPSVVKVTTTADGRLRMIYPEIVKGKMDLIVTSDRFKPNNKTHLGAKDCYGAVNIRSGTNTTLTFTFVKANTTTPVVFEHLLLSFYDLDSSTDGEVRSSLTASNYTAFNISANSKVEVIEQDTSTRFRSTEGGKGSNNVRTWPPFTSDLTRAVSLYYRKTNTVKAFIRCEGPVRKGGRNFFFSAGISYAPQQPKTTTTTTTTTTECTSSQCVVWGDPHMIPFDVHRRLLSAGNSWNDLRRTSLNLSTGLNVKAAGAFWLVKSSNLFIQGMYGANASHPQFSTLKALAVGGPLLGNATLVVRPSGNATTWNGQEILHRIPSEFVNDVLYAHYHSRSMRARDGRTGRGVDLELLGGVTLTVNRWKSGLEAVIRMCKMMGGQSGQCGNNDGNDRDDLRNFVSSSSARVAVNESLFTPYD